ncbi:MAG: DUF4231 domain-containing protein [Saccharospirillaceae bacterium]|nr:SLATT domain-containing protein [Pseudomonadales bacterium]NRB81353.1 DUF4231 domain-containing protein [Saccharospirillaceae bacterium]
MEELNTNLSFLSSEVDKNIKIIKNKQKYNKNLTGLTGILTVILSSAITLILGLDIEAFIDYQKNIALFLGSILTITNGWIMIFDYKKLWIRQKNTLLSLYQIKNKIGYTKACISLTKVDVDKLFSEYLDIWDKDSREWERIHKKDKISKNKKGEN